MLAHQVLPYRDTFSRQVTVRQPRGLTKFRAWANQNSEIYEQALEL